MKRILALTLLLGAATTLGESVSSTPALDQTSVTFHKDVLPILQKNCQTCHRPGQIAPMSFMTYESVRPFAKAIKSAVSSGKMPPWLAESGVGTYRNAPQLTVADIQTLVAWADGGAPEGNAADQPDSPEWAEGWRIRPDVVVSMERPFPVAAKGDGEIREFIIPSPFQQDTWVSSIEIRPGNPAVVHHVILQVADTPAETADRPRASCRGVNLTDESVLRAFATRNAKTGDSRFGGQYSSRRPKNFERLTGCGTFTTMEAVYAPGTAPMDFRFRDSAKLIRGGASLRLEVHYTPNGKETTDQTKVAFTLNNDPVLQRFVIMAPEHMADTRKPIRAGAADVVTRGELTFDRDVDLVWFMPHMHLRGKDMTFRLVFPDGREQTALSSRFDFNWQLGYELETPIHAPKGTRMIVTARHDNSANNRLNPNPNVNVNWGEMTTEEMMLPWFGVLIDGDARPDQIASYQPGDFEGPLPALVGDLIESGSAPASGSGSPTDAVNFPRADQSDIGFWINR